MSPSGNSWRMRALQSSRRFKHLLFSHLYQDRYRDLGRTVLVAGMARSGTTWLGSLIASQGANRLMFEPFNPWPVGPLHSSNYIQYKRPDEEDTELLDFCGRLFSGDIRHNWIDRHIDHLLPEGRVVKAVRANLMLGWLHRNFPQVPQVLIIRHPCAVVSSWLQLGWTPDQDIASFLEQPELIETSLADKRDLIQHLQTLEERIAFAWCVNHLVPLLQVQTKGMHVVFYERLISQPKVEIPELFQAIGHETHGSIYDDLNVPSMTSKNNNIAISDRQRAGQWRHKLSPGQVDRIQSVVVGFGLDFLYGNSDYPSGDISN